MAKQETTPAHEYAMIFPLHEGQPLWELSDKIEKNGQREPCVTHEGKMLDGRRRELACFRKGIKATYREFGSRKTDGDDPLEFVIDLNLHRRHLGEGERVLAAARYATAKVGNQSSQVETITNAESAEKFEVSEQAVDRAKVVLASGVPELQAAVADGTVSVSDAANAAKAPKAKQRKAVKVVREGTAKTVSAAIVGDAAEEAPEPILDALKQPVPDHLAPVFALADNFQEVLNHFSAAKRLAKELSESVAGRALNLQQYEIEQKRAWRVIRFAKPHAVCPKCGGDEENRSKLKGPCDCRGHGWMTEAEYEQITKRSPKSG
jgi:hypothetical protein